jgi:hypothetical protein
VSSPPRHAAAPGRPAPGPPQRRSPRLRPGPGLAADRRCVMPSRSSSSASTSRALTPPPFGLVVQPCAPPACSF